MSGKSGSSSGVLNSSTHTTTNTFTRPVGVSSVGVAGSRSKATPVVTHQDLNTSLRSRLSGLRQENSQLVTQSHRLISDLEDTSHQLLSANSTIGELRHELEQEKTDPARGRVTLLEAHVKSMQDTLSKSADAKVRLDHLTSRQCREREEWAIKQHSLEDQLHDVQEECSRLREACSIAEERASEKDLSPSRPLSQSLSSHSLHSYTWTPLVKQPADHTSDHAPLANSTLLHHSPLMGSTSSLSSLKSTQSTRDLYSFSSRYPSSTGYGSYLSGKTRPVGLHRPPSAGARLPGTASSPSLELERARAKIRQLEKQVSLLEEQLSDKTRAGQSYVAELTRLRSELSYERALVAEVRREARDQGAGEVARARAVHSQQCRELQDQLGALRQERNSSEQEVSHLRGQLKASRSEVTSLSGRVSELSRQLATERSSHSQAVGKLRTDIDAGSSHVAKLEHALNGCCSELASHVTRVGEATKMHQNDIETMKEKVRDLSSELATVRQQLLEKTELVSARQREATELKTELDRRHTAWNHTERELKQSLQHSEVIRQSLLQQVDRASKELDSYCVRLTEQQSVMAELKRSNAASEQTQRHKLELDERCKKLKKDLSIAIDDKKRVSLEVEHLQKRLSESERKSMEVTSRSQEAAGERQKREAMLVKLESELTAVRRELEQSRGELWEAEGRGKAKQSEMDATLDHMQQELGKRAQQVLEMDALLRSHQADTTARRLQLERNLTQRQADLRSRTQELEEITARHQEDKKIIEELRSQLSQLRSEERNASMEKRKQLKARSSELSELQRRLKEAESVGVAKSKEVESQRVKLGEVQRAERGLRGEMEEVHRRVELLQQENDSLREQHLNQVQRLQETHSTLLAGREQQATSHRLQVQQLVEQERTRQEEVSRCRAQVASLSAELAAERKVGEEGRQVIALARAEAARYQAQVSSLQRTASPNMKLLTKHSNDYRTFTPHTAAVTTLTPHTAAVTTLPPHTAAVTTLTPHTVAVETSPAKSMLDSEVESEMEFARLPPSIPLTPSTPFTTLTHHSTQANRGGIIDM